MTDIGAKVTALIRDVRREYPNTADYIVARVALSRAIEQHEAFKQKVSDAAKVYNEVGAPMGWEGFDQFIIPKPDPLADVLAATFGASLIDADELRAALEVRGLEIREKGK
jgi:hypothetical protein